MRPISFTLVLALAGCGAPSPHPQGAKVQGAKVPTTSDPKVPTTSDPKVPTTSDSKVPTTSDPKVPTTSDSKVPTTSGPNFACRLSAPVPSDDACSKDADCAPSVPCHARACVAVGKAVARTPDTVCSMNIDCSSADVNPCSCYEGRCALVPKSP